jgi:hypothetical protein
VVSSFMLSSVLSRGGYGPDAVDDEQYLLLKRFERSCGSQDDQARVLRSGGNKHRRDMQLILAESPPERTRRLELLEEQPRLE